MNKENLLKMADYIETVPPETFNMFQYRDTRDAESPRCGSVGCVIGHCTILDENKMPRDRNGQIDFDEWSESFTGLDGSTGEWQWCFGATWFHADNSPTGAAKRIRLLVEKGLPENWFEQMTRQVSLCYEEGANG